MKKGTKIEVYDNKGNLLMIGKITNISLDKSQFQIKDAKGFIYSSLMYKGCSFIEC